MVQGKKHQIQKKTQVRLAIIADVLVINTNERLIIMQKAFAVWVNMKFENAISKVCFY